MSTELIRFVINLKFGFSAQLTKMLFERSLKRLLRASFEIVEKQFNNAKLETILLN